MSEATSTGTRRAGVVLEPLDTLFFRDGRPFDPRTRATTGMPTPQTLAGALRTALLAAAGVDFGVVQARVQQGTHIREALASADAPEALLAPALRIRGPWLALVADSGGVQPLVSVPASLARHEDGGPGVWYRADPLKTTLPGWPAGGLEPLWRKTDAEAKHPGGFLAPRGLQAFLSGGVPSDADWYAPAELWEQDHRTGIAIKPSSLAAQEGMIYSAGMLSLAPRTRGGHRVAFYGEIVATGELPVDNISSLGAIPFGGQGRHVTLAEVPPFAWPCAAQPSPRDGDVAVLTTPGLFAEGWLPRSLASEIVAAFVPSPLPVSGWDVARGGPRRTRFAAPAGAVYFTKPGLPAIDEPLSDEEDDREQGWGLALKGAWNHVS